MADTSKIGRKSLREVYYYRQRFKNRVFATIASFFAEYAERTGATQRDLADKLDRDPAQINRWLAHPSNLTLDSVSDFLLAMDAEAEPPKIVSFADRPAPNYAHPLVARVLGRVAPIAPAPPPVTDALQIELRGRNASTSVAILQYK